MESIICAKCGQHKPRSAFNKATFSKDGLSAWCLACKNAYNVAWRKKRPKRLTFAQKWARDNKELIRAYQQSVLDRRISS